MPVADAAFGLDHIQGGAVDPVSVIYVMEAIQNGTTRVTWKNLNDADVTGTGPNAPSGTLTRIGILAIIGS